MNKFTSFQYFKLLYQLATQSNRCNQLIRRLLQHYAHKFLDSSRTAWFRLQTHELWISVFISPLDCTPGNIESINIKLILFIFGSFTGCLYFPFFLSSCFLLSTLLSPLVNTYWHLWPLGAFSCCIVHIRHYYTCPSKVACGWMHILTLIHLILYFCTW